MFPRFNFVFIGVLSWLVFTRADCPCPDASLCQPVQQAHWHEKVAFMVTKTNWPFYDYSQLTTLVICTDDFDPQLVCLAHSHQVRLIWMANFDVKQLSNATARQLWIDTQVKKVQRTHTDGLNFDLEDPIADGDPAAQFYTELVRDVTERLHREVPGSKVSVDVGWTAPCIYGRCYDYKGLALASDFLFVMAYDVRTQIHNLEDCVASANAPLALITAGLNNYTDYLQIPTSKLVLGVPWYCFDYPCLSLDANLTCAIPHVSFRGAPCSELAGVQRSYADCQNLLRFNSTTGRLIDPITGGIFFNYKDQNNGTMHQVWMDDPQTLMLKYQMANDRHLLGIGMFQADCLDYSANATNQDTIDMWNAMKQFPSLKTMPIC